MQNLPEENDSEYTRQILTYLKNGNLPSHIQNEHQLLTVINTFTKAQKGNLGYIIDDELPKNSWSYLAPMIENIPRAAVHGLIIGIAIFTITYCIFDDQLHALGLGFACGLISFCIECNYVKQTKKQQGKDYVQRSIAIRKILNESQNQEQEITDLKIKQAELLPTMKRGI